MDEMLRADLDAPPKQRHTAHRIWERLVDEHGTQMPSTARPQRTSSAGYYKCSMRARPPCPNLTSLAANRTLALPLPKIGSSTSSRSSSRDLMEVYQRCHVDHQRRLLNQALFHHLRLADGHITEHELTLLLQPETGPRRDIWRD